MSGRLCCPTSAHAGKKLLALAVTAAILASVLAQSKPDPAATSFALTIVHTNDWHANHVEQKPAGDGGSARQATVIKQIQKDVRHVLLLDAGDRFTGTVLHQPGGIDNIPLMNDLGYHAMTLGNHEFDDGDEKLALFVKSVHFPIISANLDVSRSRELRGKVQPSTVVTIDGQKIGVIGLTTADSRNNSSPGKDLVFSEDYSGCVQQAVTQLEKTGVNKIVVLSHIGLDEDRKLAAKVSHVDVIVGGHSHTVLSNTSKEAKDVYPVVVKDRDGLPVYIVQAGGGDGRYVGRLNLEFNAAGVVTGAAGDCIYLAKSVEAHPATQAKVDAMSQRVAGLMAKPIVGSDGRNAVALDEFPANRVRDEETAIGNLVCDAVRKRAGADVALIGSGSIRNGFPAGTITLGTLANSFPFNNTLCVVRIKGKVIVEALEHGLSKYTVESGRGRFQQVSGLRFQFDPAQPVGKRVVRVEVLGPDRFDPLDPERIYRVACDSFQLGGGDDFTMLKSQSESTVDLGYPVRDVLQHYIAEHSPLRARIEGRIKTR